MLILLPVLLLQFQPIACNPCPPVLCAFHLSSLQQHSSSRTATSSTFSSDIVYRSGRPRTRTSLKHWITLDAADAAADDDDDDDAQSDDDVGQRQLLVPESSFLLDPLSDASHALLVKTWQLNEPQYMQLCQLTRLVCEWNGKVNLISRKHCNASMVWTRHVLPSCCCCAAVMATATQAKADEDLHVALEIPPQPAQRNNHSMLLPIHSARSVIDIGTGGGFPGLPLAIVFPGVQFWLLDSVGKKIRAVRDMAQQLNLTNVHTYHGRAEELAMYFQQAQQQQQQQQSSLSSSFLLLNDDEKKDLGLFDVAVGRSVTSLPRFAAWALPLVKPSTGSLMYWTGGMNRGGDDDDDDGEEEHNIQNNRTTSNNNNVDRHRVFSRQIQALCQMNVPIEPFLRRAQQQQLQQAPGIVTDKHILTFDYRAIQRLVDLQSQAPTMSVKPQQKQQLQSSLKLRQPKPQVTRRQRRRTSATDTPRPDTLRIEQQQRRRSRKRNV